LEKIDNLLEEIKNIKSSNVDDLITVLSETNDVVIRDKIAFFLVDNFNDIRIEETLVELIKDNRWKNYKGTLIYLLSEYTADNKYLHLLIDLILDNEIGGEVFMDSYSMLLSLHTPFNPKELNKSLKHLRKEKEKNTDLECKKLIDNLICFIEGQREIIKFLKKFN